MGWSLVLLPPQPCLPPPHTPFTPTTTQVPLVDMADHSLDFNCEVHSHDDGSVTMLATRAIQAGTPVFYKYGSHGNADLLTCYGFVVRGNPHDLYAVALSMDTLMV